MITTTANGYTITYPNQFFETRGRFAYVKVQGDGTVDAGEDIEITLQTTESNKVTVLRTTNPQKTAVFPIGAICESIAYKGEKVTISIYKGNANVNTGTIEVYPVVGYWDREMNTELKDNGIATITSPFAYRIMIYPNAGFEQTLFVPFSGRCDMYAGMTTIAENVQGPYIPFDPSTIPSDQYKNLYLDLSQTYSATIRTSYDTCTNGVFLKWTDAAGMPYLYRWTQETETDDVSVDSTYRKLDDTLTPYDVQTKTRTKRYTLHSRIVERDIFEMCRTILGAQEVFMYDRDADDWVRVLIEDAESEDTGAVMQDVEIEVVKYEYL